MSAALTTQRILFLGAGSMAEAIIRGLVSTYPALSATITVTNRSNKEKLEHLHNAYGVATEQDPDRIRELAAKADVVVVAMKPVDAPKALAAYRGVFHEDQLLVSVIAGLSIKVIRHLVGSEALPVARTMPNTSSSIGLGMTGISFSHDMPSLLQQTTLDIFQAIGDTVLTEEDQLHILTGISGSGPAYVYAFAEALVSGGVKGGLRSESAKELAISTLLGAASMLRQTGEAPEVLRRKVTSPNGTTQAALETLARHSFQEGIEQAVLRCAERSREIGETINSSAAELLP
ncbi:pyrroline-5-carboxylate reductase [Gorillibacterium sp. CAU 1737]|uniref:pyrroline-5-carboxylate reductase n=1 Tax=Gorillibacterium sp. CAU 1737 TaxID=3140362 RepID=UPI0032605337